MLRSTYNNNNKSSFLNNKNKNKNKSNKQQRGNNNILSASSSTNNTNNNTNNNILSSEYPLIKSIIIIFGLLFVLPICLSHYIIKNSYEYQRICHVGPTTTTTMSSTSSFGGSNEIQTTQYQPGTIYQPSSTGSSSSNNNNNNNNALLLSTLYGTYRSFDDTSYYYIQEPWYLPTFSTNNNNNNNNEVNNNEVINNEASSNEINTDTTNNNVRHRSNVKNVVNGAYWWSISTLVHKTISVKTLNEKKRQYFTMKQQQQQQQMNNVNVNPSINHKPPAIKWDQSHTIEEKQESIDSNYIDNTDDEISSNPELAFRYGGSSDANVGTSSKQFISPSGQSKSGTSGTSRWCLQANTETNFQICTDPQPSLMSNADNDPFFVELPLQSPPTTTWNVYEKGIVMNNNQEEVYNNNNPNPIPYSNTRPTNNIKMQVNVQCHIPPSSLNGLALGVTDPKHTSMIQEPEIHGIVGIHSNSNSNEDMILDPRNNSKDEIFDDGQYGRFVLIGTYMLILLLIVCSCLSSHGHTATSVKNTNTSNSMNRLIMSCNIVSAILSQLSSNSGSSSNSSNSSSSFNLCWNILWLYILGHVLESYYGTILYISIHVSILCFIASMSCYGKGKYTRFVLPKSYIYVIVTLTVIVTQEFQTDGFYLSLPIVNYFFGGGSGIKITSINLLPFLAGSNGSSRFTGIYVNALPIIVWLGHKFTSTTTTTTSRNSNDMSTEMRLVIPCIVLGIIIPQSLNVFASPQFIVPVTLFGHLLWFIMPFRTIRGGGYNKLTHDGDDDDEHDGNDDDDVGNDDDDYTGTDNADGDGDDDYLDSDMFSMSSRNSQTTAASTASQDATDEEKGGDQQFFSVKQRNNLHNFSLNELDDDTSVYSINSVKTEAIQALERESLMGSSGKGSNNKTGDNTDDDDGGSGDQQRERERHSTTMSKRIVFVCIWLIILVLFGMIVISIYPISIDWTLNVGHAITLLLFVGSQRHQYLIRKQKEYLQNRTLTQQIQDEKKFKKSYKMKKKTGNSKTTTVQERQQSQPTTSTFAFNKQTLVTMLLWSHYHMVSAVTIIVVDVMTLIGWYHAHVAISTYLIYGRSGGENFVTKFIELLIPSSSSSSSYFSPYTMAWYTLIVQVSLHFIAFLITSITVSQTYQLPPPSSPSQPKPKQRTILLPGHFLWDNAKTFGEECLDLFCSIDSDDDDDDDDDDYEDGQER